MRLRKEVRNGRNQNTMITLLKSIFNPDIKFEKYEPGKPLDN
jgi:hypothetical protein